MGVSPLGKDSIWEINLAARVAWMSFLGGLTQSEIGKRLGLSPIRVHRLILLAREKGLVRISIEGRPAECLNLEAHITSQFGLRSCTVSPYLRNNDSSEDVALASVGQTAGQLIGQHLQVEANKSIAVGAGRTMLSAVTAMPSVSRPDLLIYSLNGGLTRQLSITQYDVVPLLAERTGGRAFVLPIPYFARSYQEYRLYLDQPSVAKVRNAAEQADIIMSSIGTIYKEMSNQTTELLTIEEVKKLDKKGAVAELAGLFINKYGKIVEQDIVYSFGADISKFSLVSKRKSRRIFALAAGNYKVQATLAVLKSGIVSDLIIDENLAEGLKIALDGI